MTKSPKLTEAFVKLPRTLLESEAWRSLGINARRFLEFLMLEHMRHGGKKNGSLFAPRRQLERFGIGATSVPQSRKRNDSGLPTVTAALADVRIPMR